MSLPYFTDASNKNLIMYDPIYSLLYSIELLDTYNNEFLLYFIDNCFEYKLTYKTIEVSVNLNTNIFNFKNIINAFTKYINDLIINITNKNGDIIKKIQLTSIFLKDFSFEQSYAKNDSLSHIKIVLNYSQLKETVQ
jgi:hypothetical protein